ncbi:type II toxin-antitoxin system BrnA family antitoxin [Nitrosophilus alvini]|uniref:type II toxin-antitoxin system BrnA family antitoxin n=1 Tax=Nitrosophilus alvini TaxID=2714855 RepID=UPI00190D356D|nr:hypothetical protein [Nitrosophilus alvini]
MKAAEFDKKFDENESVIEDLDLKKIKKPNLQIKRINIDFPLWLVEKIDKEAKKLGVSRQAIIKMWLAQKVEHGF